MLTLNQIKVSKDKATYLFHDGFTPSCWMLMVSGNNQDWLLQLMLNIINVKLDPQNQGFVM